ncbi:MAG: cob(I)yrinic acid a,c-diamide adenosyltransferase [Planctomycetota bacterium]|nr:cob(I)yrinic acid a,c-diamide adenosyltransferase [Planctomycetota bacterium]
MVELNRIYTRSGDDGTTSLGDGTRLPKNHLRISAYGTVDELSSVLGLTLAHGAKDPIEGLLKQIQNDLFDAGADLCVPGESGDGLRITAAYTDRIERWIDEHNADLAPLSSFVLAGGEPIAAWLHLARTVCRRAERLVVALRAQPEDKKEIDRVNPEVLRYLNRLSDLFFVLARLANDKGAKDVLWKPGGSQQCQS